MADTIICSSRAMVRCRALQVQLTGMLLAAAASAGPALSDPAYDSCMDQSDGTNTAWSMCGGELVEREEARLNDMWKVVFPKLPPQAQIDLRAEQRAWVAFKDRSCAYYANGEFGREGQVLHAPLCRAGIIRERTDYLRELDRFIEEWR